MCRLRLLREAEGKVACCLSASWSIHDIGHQDQASRDEDEQQGSSRGIA